MPPRKSGISAATLVLSDESGHMIDMPFLTIHLRSRQDQVSVSASDACASLAFARGAAVILGVPLGHRRVSCRTRAVATRSALGHSRRKRLGPLATHVRCTSKSGHKCGGPL